MEEEARTILKTALASSQRPPRNLSEAIRARFVPFGGVVLPELPRKAMRKPPDFRK